MPRHIRATAREVQKSRAEWYAFHYEQRAKAEHLTANRLESYQHVARLIAPPTMTVFGGVPENFPERRAYEIAYSSGLDVNLINPWYLSESGWQTFQNLWAQLPEPVDILSTPPCVQLGELFHLSTMPEASKPRK